MSDHANLATAEQQVESAPASQQSPPPPPPPPLSPPPPNGAVPLTDDGGVYKLALADKSAAGNGCNGISELMSPNSGDRVTVHWVGRYHGGDRDGEQFGSTRDPAGRTHGQPISFKLDDGHSLRAIERCLLTMGRGESCRLFARFDYAYGGEEDQAGDAPCCGGGCGGDNAFATDQPVQPGAGVAFELELVNWQAEDLSAEKDGSLLRSRVQHGEGFVSPTLASRVTVQLRGRLVDDTAVTGVGLEFLPSYRLEFELGDIRPVAEGVCSGVEAALGRMFKGEVARVWLAPHLGYGAAGCPDLGVPPDARLLYDIELVDFAKPSEVWQLTRREKLAEAARAKARGLECLAAGNLPLAHLHCKRVVDYLEWEADFRDDAELQSERQCLLTAGRLNLALVCLKLAKYQQVITQCTAVLKDSDSKSEKALYRRGMAWLNKCDYDQAMTDFRACLAVSPGNTAAKAGIEKCHAGMRSLTEREKRVFAGMFDRFAKQDAKSRVGGDQSRADFVIDTWDNRLADGMLSIQQELEAFGEEMPQKKRGGGGGHGHGHGHGSGSRSGGVGRVTIAEVDEEK